MEKLFKKGDKVIVTTDCDNASECDISLGRGVYKLPNVKNIVFTIEGTVKLFSFSHNPDVFCAYALSLNNKIIGYVYNTALELAPKMLSVTHLWNFRMGEWISNVGTMPIIEGANATLITDNIYSVYWSDGVTALYKGEIK